MSWPLLPSLGSRTSGQGVPNITIASRLLSDGLSTAHCPSLPPENSMKVRGTQPHAYGIQGFPAPPLHPSCPLPASLKWATSSSLSIPSPKNTVRDEGNPKCHVHGIQKGPQHPPAAPTLCPQSVVGRREDRLSSVWKLGWLRVTVCSEQGKMKWLDVLVVSGKEDKRDSCTARETGRLVKEGVD